MIAVLGLLSGEHWRRRRRCRNL